MLEDIKDMLSEPLKIQQEAAMKNQAVKMGSVHFMITIKNKENLLELQWNEYIGRDIDPDTIKEKINQWKQLIK